MLRNPRKKHLKEKYYTPAPHTAPAAKEYKAQESRQLKGKNNVGTGILGEIGHPSQLQKTPQTFDKLTTQETYPKFC